MKVVLFFAFFLLLGVVESYKILGVFPMPSKSHYILASSSMKHLLANGHEVTLVSGYMDKNKHPKMTEVILDGLVESFKKKTSNMLDRDDSGVFHNIFIVYGLASFVTNYTLTHPNVQKLLQSNEHFDLVFVESFATDAFVGLGERFNAPVVGLGTFGSATWLDQMIGNPVQASIMSHTLSPFTDKMNFWQRAANLFFIMTDNLLLRFYYYPMQEEIYNLAFPNAKKRFIDAVRNDMSLIFINSHFSFAYPRAYAPNTIEVGGIQVDRTAKPLPKDLQAYLDSATDGVVYFSMGSVIQAKLLPTEKREAILKVFAKYPKIKFLWKWEDTELPGKPDNLLVQNWFPQNDILAHKNVRFFITHGGLLSTTESIYQGVPVVGIPIFGDQNLNMIRAQKAGYGLILKYKNLTEESLDWAVSELLREPRYRVAAKEISRRYRDTPQTPGETLNFWCEYVIRHKGAPFLKSAAQELNFLQYHMLDVLAFYIGVVFAGVWAMRKVLKSLRAAFCGEKKKKSSKNKKNN